VLDLAKLAENLSNHFKETSGGLTTVYNGKMTTLKSVFSKLLNAKIIAKKLPKHSFEEVAKIMDFLIDEDDNFEVLEEHLKGPGNKNLLKVIEVDIKGGETSPAPVDTKKAGSASKKKEVAPESPTKEEKATRGRKKGSASKVDNEKIARDKKMENEEEENLNSLIKSI